MEFSFETTFAPRSFVNVRWGEDINELLVSQQPWVTAGATFAAERYALRCGFSLPCGLSLLAVVTKR